MNIQTRSIGYGLLLIVCAGAPFLVGTYEQGVLLQFFCWVALTASWTAFSGMTGYISLGHAVFYGLGGYLLALSWGQLPLPVILVLVGLAGGLFALVLGLPALRVRGPYFVILTFGLSEFAKYVVVAVESALGSSGRLLMQVPSTLALCLIMLALAAFSIGVLVWLDRSRLGVALRSVREDELAAVTLGVPATSVKLLAFVLSAVVPAMAGAVLALRTAFFEPMHMFNPMTSFTILTMAIIGGSDRPAGPILGAALLTFLSELLWARVPELYMTLLGVLLLFFVFFVPEGLAGRFSKFGLRTRIAKSGAAQEVP